MNKINRFTSQGSRKRIIFRSFAPLHLIHWPWWHHDKEHFPCYRPFVRGIHRSPVHSPRKGPVTRSFHVFVDVRLNKLLNEQLPVIGEAIIFMWHHWNGDMCNATKQTDVNSDFRRALLNKDTHYLAIFWLCHVGDWSETWWRHQTETFSALLAICAGNSPVPGQFPAQRPVTRSFDVFFDLRLNSRMSK